MTNPNYADELAAAVADLVDKAKTICEDARLALSGDWGDMSGASMMDGFEAQLVLLEPSINRAEKLLIAAKKDPSA